MEMTLKYLLIFLSLVNFGIIHGQEQKQFTGIVWQAICPIHSYFMYKDHPIDGFTGTDTIKEKLFVDNPQDSIFIDEMIDIFIHYKDGKKVLVEGFYDNGKLYKKVTYLNKRLNGEYLIYYKNGQIQNHSYYIDGKSIFSLSYYSSGQLEGLSKSDSPDENSDAYMFYKSGKIKYISEDIDSTKKDAFKETSYYENGVVESTSISNLGIQTYSYFYDNGVKKGEGNMINMPLFQVGKWQEWYENGILKSEVYYDDSIPNLQVGTWSYWNEEGELIKQEKYKDGKLVDVKEFLPVKNKKD